MADTDSEHAFCGLMQELAKSHADVPSVDELTRTLAELQAQAAAHGTFNVLLSNVLLSNVLLSNVLLSNGQALRAHASTALHWLQRRHPFGAATLADDGLSVDFAARSRPPTTASPSSPASL